MSTKIDRKPHEPGWGEVILGAVLSVILGVALGVVALVFKPVLVVKEMPKDPTPGATYFIEGSRDTGKAKQAAAKRKAFAQGASGTFSVIEDEINTLAGPATPMGAAPAKKPGDKPAAAPAAGAAPAAPAPDGVSTGTPNFRIRDNAVQIGVPVQLGFLGADLRVIVQAKGNFVKKDGLFTFVPDTLLLGGCPMDRLPYGASYVTKKFLSGQTIAEDISANWPKLTDVHVEGSVLKLTLP